MSNSERESLKIRVFEAILNGYDLKSSRTIAEEIMPLIDTYVESRERQAETRGRISEHNKWKTIAEEIVEKDGVYRAVNYLNTRTQQLQRLTELESTQKENK